MGTRVIVRSFSPSRISINNQQSKTVRTIGVVSASTNKLESMIDVDASDPDNNETLVYDSASGKYVVKILPAVDGGTF